LTELRERFGAFSSTRICHCLPKVFFSGLRKILNVVLASECTRKLVEPFCYQRRYLGCFLDKIKLGMREEERFADVIFFYLDSNEGYNFLVNLQKYTNEISGNLASTLYCPHFGHVIFSL